jgi:hypothetical protein
MHFKLALLADAVSHPECLCPGVTGFNTAVQWESRGRTGCSGCSGALRAGVNPSKRLGGLIKGVCVVSSM